MYVCCVCVCVCVNAEPECEYIAGAKNLTPSSTPPPTSAQEQQLPSPGTLAAALAHTVPRAGAATAAMSPAARASLVAEPASAPEDPLSAGAAGAAAGGKLPYGWGYGSGVRAASGTPTPPLNSSGGSIISFPSSNVTADMVIHAEAVLPTVYEVSMCKAAHTHTHTRAWIALIACGVEAGRGEPTYIQLSTSLARTMYVIACLYAISFVPLCEFPPTCMYACAYAHMQYTGTAVNCYSCVHGLHELV